MRNQSANQKEKQLLIRVLFLMSYKRHYSDQQILELCNEFGIDPSTIDKQEIEENMLDFCNQHNIDTEKIDINQVEKDLLETMQRLGMDLAEYNCVRN